jgi:hypothetical protein
MRYRGPGEVKLGEYVCPEGLLKIVKVELRKFGLRMLFAGIIEKTLQAAQLANGLLDNVLAKARIADIAGKCYATAPVLFDRPLRFARVLRLVQVGEGNIGSLHRGADGDCTADPGVAPCNENDAIVKHPRRPVLGMHIARLRPHLRFNARLPVLMLRRNLNVCHTASVPPTAWSFFTASVRALIPNLLLDVGGTIAVYYALLAFFSSTSLVPLYGATLVPALSIAFNVWKKRRIDVIGVIVLVGLLLGIAAVFMGGTQRLLLVRESFVSGAMGLALFVSPVFPKPLGYYVMRSFMTQNDVAPFDTLWENPPFRRTVRSITLFWGCVLLVEFGLRISFALMLPVVFTLGVGPLISNGIMLAAGAVTAIAMGQAIAAAL